MQTHEQIQEELNAQVVATIQGRPVTRGELKAQFERVCPPNWKNPIDARVLCTTWEVALVREAIVFFTGSVATVTTAGRPVQGRRYYRVTARGYYAAVGA